MQNDAAEDVGRPSQKLELVWGAEAIAAELGVSLRRAQGLLQAKRLPARKIGKHWVIDRRVLARVFLEDGGAA
jgi:hypothetical protein